MKSKTHGLGVILLLAVFSLAFSLSGFGYGQVTPEQKALIDLMKVDRSAEISIGREFLGKAKESLAQQIDSDFQLMGLFRKENDFRGLDTLMGKRGAALTTPSFEKVPGAGSAKFWEGLLKAGLGLKLVPVHIQVTGAITPQPVPLSTLIDQGGPIKDAKGNPILYDAVAVFIFECHIVEEKAGTTGHNDTLEIVFTYLHKTGCPWG